MMKLKNIFNQHYQSWLRWLPALLLAIAIFAFSATSGDEIHDTYESFEATVQVVTTPAVAPAEPVAVPVPPAVDWLKMGHVIGYFWLGIAVLYGLSARSRWSPGIALILSCLYSITDEFHQCFTPGRTASEKDILIDTLAALLGLTITLGVMASRKFFSRKR
jgi:VanZ family protein